MLHLFFFSFVFLFVLIQTYSVICKFRRRKRGIKSIGFFHPYCNAGGGGERVLWTAIRAVQKRYKHIHCVVYSGDQVPSEEIVQNVKRHFNIDLVRDIEIIHLNWRHFVEDKYYPVCTLLMQSLGSMIVGLEALIKHSPDIYIDTMGYAWTLPIFKFIGLCRIGAYVHYPTISTDMLEVVKERKVGINNKAVISNSYIFSCLKLIYYRIFAFLYGLVGRRAEVIMVNSSWTNGHILDLWKKPDSTFIVYPPCDVSVFNKISLDSHDDKTSIVSIAQFRPEKNHELQINAFHNFFNRLKDPLIEPELILIGSCRHSEDFQRVEKLKDLCRTLGIMKAVSFKINLSFGEVIQEMENACTALHTMSNEHFGIGVVECMSAGLIMIAHDSGGPKMDIVTNYSGEKTGFLAHDVQSFAQVLEDVWKMDNRDLMAIRRNARHSVSRFSNFAFENSFIQATKPLFK